LKDLAISSANFCPCFVKEKIVLGLPVINFLFLKVLKGLSNFRANTYEKAKELQLLGWVRNLPDGRVEIVAEGEKERVEKLIEWAKVGPSLAKVENVQIKWEEYQGEFEDFKIRYD